MLVYLNDKRIAREENFSQARQASVLDKENTNDRRVAISTGRDIQPWNSL